MADNAPACICFTSKPAIIEGIIPTFEKTEYRPPIFFSCFNIVQLLACAIWDRGLILFSVITNTLENNNSKLFFWSNISIILANWLSVSGVEPDLEITIKPVELKSILLKDFSKKIGSILSKKEILFLWLLIFINVF